MSLYPTQATLVVCWAMLPHHKEITIVHNFLSIYGQGQGLGFPQPVVGISHPLWPHGARLGILWSLVGGQVLGCLQPVFGWVLPIPVTWWGLEGGEGVLESNMGDGSYDDLKPLFQTNTFLFIMFIYV